MSSESDAGPGRNGDGGGAPGDTGGHGTGYGAGRPPGDTGGHGAGYGTGHAPGDAPGDSSGDSCEYPDGPGYGPEGSGYGPDGPAVPYGPNAARVLGLLRAAGEQGADRGELAMRTGLTPQAVSKITARLRSHGLVTEAGRRASTGGKPSTVLRLAPAARHAVGIQLDRDLLTAVLVDLSGGVVAGRTAPLDLGAEPDVLLDTVASAVHGLIGVALPGSAPGRATGNGGAEDRAGAEGGELWRQAPRGERGGTRADRRFPESRPPEGRGAEGRPAEARPPGSEPSEGQGTGTRPSAAGAEPAAARQAAARRAAEQQAAAARADDRRAVAAEGELWRDGTGRAAPAGVQGVRETEPGAEPEPRRGTGPATGGPASGTDADTGTGAGARHTAEPAAEPAAETEEEAEAAVGIGTPDSRWGSVVGVGVAAPGPLDHARGVLGPVTGLPDRTGLPLRDALARRLGLPVVLDKDTNAAALGLAPRGRESLAYVHFGTGIGAGLVLDGRIHRGRRTGAGEFGHQVLQLDGPRCRCGRYGCLEVLCMDAVEHGRPAEAARLLGIGAANLVRLLDVDRVLLGGRTVLAAPDTFVDGVAARLHAETGTAGAPGAVRVELAPEGARTVADGAAQLVLAPLFGRTPDRPAR